MLGRSGNLEQSGNPSGHSGNLHRQSSNGECARSAQTTAPANRENLQHFILGHNGPSKPFPGLRLSIDEAENPREGMIAPAPGPPKRAPPR